MIRIPSLLVLTTLATLPRAAASTRQNAPPDPASAGSLPCVAGADVAAPDDAKAIHAVTSRLEAQAEAANLAGDHLRVAFLLLQVERHLPMCAAAARADRVERAIAALRRAHESGDGTGPLDAASAVAEAFLADVEVVFGTEAADREEIVVIHDELRALRVLAERPRPPPLKVLPPQPAHAQRAPVQPAGPTPAERAEHQRRTLGLAAGVGVSAALTLAAAGAGLGTRLRVVEGGALHREIQRAAEASTADAGPDNDVAHGAGSDICQASRAAQALGGGDADVASLCEQRTQLLNASTGLWVATGALTATTAVLATLLAVYRRGPVARALERRAAVLHGGPMRGGAAIGLAVRF